ncbi:Hypothetical protein Tpal_482 [Trichococcus palustris]|uniref:Uncharacterized protein n=1 Tax=Trichococcus palustris TaxID=140314 RepID=A0A143Y9X7_9LACT|nr:hypothetical protein [Trichococcus palustris]CZQ83745.1 Hypothetical protein Tpal_482 [Trichococcus palustris]SFK70492.1 hypothetical protein SAMN04488076_103192 [Trichococcus palustris]
MNKRQLKKKVKQALRRGPLLMTAEDRHIVRTYGNRYYTQEQVFCLIDAESWRKLGEYINEVIEAVVQGIKSFAKFIGEFEYIPVIEDLEDEE